jgi:hypothetical protein
MSAISGDFLEAKHPVTVRCLSNSFGNSRLIRFSSLLTFQWPSYRVQLEVGCSIGREFKTNLVR